MAETFGQALQRFRERRGIKRYELPGSWGGSKIRWSYTMIRELEEDARHPRAETITALGARLGLKAEDIQYLNSLAG